MIPLRSTERVYSTTLVTVALIAINTLIFLYQATLNPYDLLIVDLMLPGLSGTELIRRVRRQNTDVPIVVLTARDALSDKLANFESGAIVRKRIRAGRPGQMVIDLGIVDVMVSIVEDHH